MIASRLVANFAPKRTSSNSYVCLEPMAKAITDRTHNFVERIGIDVESKAKNILLFDVG
jgi:hypothetical protein